VRGLRYRYPRASVAALDGVDLDAHAGQVLGLLGPNGAGKTTLLALLAGLWSADAGSITLDGAPLAAIRTHQPQAIALAPQDDAFYPMLSVRENLACFAAAAGLAGATARVRIAAVLGQTQLERHAAQRAQRLSGGLKRRLNLAITLLPEPRVLLLDEPTSGVDPQSRAFLREVIGTLAQEGRIVILSSHLMSDIEMLAQRVVILDQGRLLCAGSLPELLAQALARTGQAHLEPLFMALTQRELRDA
jgi:ABC-2 type transport system ATP-binding protein